ncbi:hypothetical protein BRADI_5g12334v3 [Brachypodium distachyon]|uniref:Uncharacterized protein n=1 Tax=Brachypodium distachyon TaxID=15368 RepID=A0A0Q3E9B2_BRADI|nr:hypothetical protein BRADI_5g12334v3 [Brachypodium distachyon]
MSFAGRPRLLAVVFWRAGRRWGGDWVRDGGSGEQHGAPAQGQTSRVAAANACAAAAQLLRSRPPTWTRRRHPSPARRGCEAARGCRRGTSRCSSAEGGHVELRRTRRAPGSADVRGVAPARRPGVRRQPPVRARITCVVADSRVILHQCSSATRLVALRGEFLRPKFSGFILQFRV